MGAAFEVNRQMCDIVLLAKENIRLCKENQERAKLLDEAFKKKFGNDMEKKKMTKAEAFEWLDGKKIRTVGNHEKVLRKLFDLGFVWKNLRDTRVDLGWQSGEVYGLTISNGEVAWWATPHSFDTYGAEQASVHDILTIEIVEEDKPKSFSDYVAVIQSQLVDDEVVVITKKNFMTMVK